MGRAINEPGEDVATSRDSLPLASWRLRELEMVLDFEDFAIVLSKETFLFFSRFFDSSRKSSQASEANNLAASPIRAYFNPARLRQPIGCRSIEIEWI